MRRLAVLFLLAVVSLGTSAQSRTYSQPELDALLAPVALYPDTVLSQVLVAATHPDDVREAAAWLRANPHLKGEDAVRAAEPILWDPSLKALLAFPDLLARMDESPQWTADLGSAFLTQEPQVMDTVQALRRRAQASGALHSDAHQQVLEDGRAVVVQPLQPQVVYVRYYDPYVVYGPWWWHSYRPVVWRPWHPRPALVVSTGFVHHHVDWHRRHVHRPAVVHHQHHRHVPVHRAPVTVHNHVHQAQRARPIVQGAHIRPLVEPSRREHRVEPRRGHHHGHHGHGRGHQEGRRHGRG